MKSALSGKPDLKSFNIIQVKAPEQYSCASIDEEQTKEFDFVKELPSVFNGLGKIQREPNRIELVEGATPYHASSPRRVALPLLEQLGHELNRIEELEVIRRVEKPTDRCPPIVVQKSRMEQYVFVLI